ncbi:MAG: lysophospholipid acyltransferase family protein [Myxococcota bacterium]
MNPADLARWAFYVQLRRALDPGRPAPFRVLRRLGRLTAMSPAPLMADEYRRCGIEPCVPAARRAQYRAAVDELVLGKLTRETIDGFVRFEGLQHLDAALARKKGVVWVYPHAGAVMLMLAGLVQRGYRYTQYAARGLAPKEVAEAHPELLGHNRWRAAVREAREADEDHTGATFLTLSAPTRELYRALSRNELVGIAFDGRIGNKWRPFPFLGRTALLNPGPFRLAASTGAMLVPCYNTVQGDGPALCTVGEPVDPARPDAAEAVLAFAERAIRASPAEYGAWLLHCRLRNDIDDHPLFTDHAVDDRWKRWSEP